MKWDATEERDDERRAEFSVYAKHSIIYLSLSN